jgi:hypothetical protein
LVKGSLGTQVELIQRFGCQHEFRELRGVLQSRRRNGVQITAEWFFIVRIALPTVTTKRKTLKPVPEKWFDRRLI